MRLFGRKDTSQTIVGWREECKMDHTILHDMDDKNCRAAADQLESGDLSGALKRCNRAVREMPDVVELRAVKAMLLLKMGKLRQAERCYREVLEANPDHTMALMHMGIITRRKGNPGEAIPYYDDALESHEIRTRRRDRNLSMIHNNKGVALAGAGRPEAALQEFNAAIDADSKYFLAHCNKGITLLIMGDDKKAAKCFRTASMLNPREIYVWV